MQDFTRTCSSYISLTSERGPGTHPRDLAGVQGVEPPKVLCFGHFENQTKRISEDNFTFNLDDFW